MARQRRTNVTASSDGGDENKGDAKPVNPKVGKITTKRPGTGLNPAVRKIAPGGAQGGNTAAKRAEYAAQKKKKSLIKTAISLVILLVLAGVAWKMYSNYQEAEAEKIRIAQLKIEQEAEAKRLRLLQQEEAKKAEEARKRQLAEEEERRKLEEAQEKARLARLQREEEEKRKAYELEIARKSKEEQQRRIKAAQDALDDALVKAVELAAKGEFSEAATLINSRLNADAQDKTRAQKLYNNYRDFSTKIEEIKPGPDAIAENMFDFSLKDGQTIRAKLENEGITDITIIKNGGVKIILPRNKIDTKKIVTQEALDKITHELIISRAREGKSGVDFYNVGIYSLEHAQKDLAVKAFNKAVELDEDIARSYYEFEARKLFASAAFDRSLRNPKSAQRKFDKLATLYPDSRACKLMQGAVEGEGKVIAHLATKKTGATGSAAVKPDSDENILAVNTDLNKAKQDMQKDGGQMSVKIADTLASEAASLEKKAQSSEDRKQSNILYKDAVKKLSKAIAIYQDYLAKKPDKEVEARFEDTARRYYWCKKMQTL